MSTGDTQKFDIPEKPKPDPYVIPPLPVQDLRGVGGVFPNTLSREEEEALDAEWERRRQQKEKADVARAMVEVARIRKERAVQERKEWEEKNPELFAKEKADKERAEEKRKHWWNGLIIVALAGYCLYLGHPAYALALVCFKLLYDALIRIGDKGK